MEKIKSFIYLDSDKINSLSAQLFGGITEHIEESEKEQLTETEEQKGSLSSGKKLGDSSSKEKSKIKNTLYHDHLYNMFEQNLIESGRVKEISKINVKDINDLKILDFIKLKGTLIFNDSKEILKSITEFNNLGKAVASISVQSIATEIKETIEETKDRNKKSKLNVSLKGELNKAINSYIKENNLCLDEDYAKDLKYILEYGLQDLLEVQIILDKNSFSSILNREFLRESEKILISKFSRKTEVEFILFGYITQTKNYIPKSTIRNIEGANLKGIFQNLIESLIDVESNFIGKSVGDIIVDPISIYLEI